MSSTDNLFMKSAMTMARRSLGLTWPNPSVGAVIVSPGCSPEVIARGRTMPGGRPHAERIALDKAGSHAKGSTLYVTLEPCAHHGKTPPCTEAIIEAGVSRVVCSAHDPDKRVAGAGIAKLKEAGVETKEGVLQKQGSELAMGHALRVSKNRPMVQLKLAVGSDGRIPQGSGSPVWATGRQARSHGHLLRARCDAILVGSATVTADDPELTCRLSGLSERSPVRVVLDSKLQISKDAKLVCGADKKPLWLLCSQEADQDTQTSLEDLGALVERVGQSKEGGLSPEDILVTLANRGITRLLIEGGPRVAESFLKANLIDEIYLYQGAEPVGSTGLKALSTFGIDKLKDSSFFKCDETRSLGKDSLSIYRRHDPSI